MAPPAKASTISKGTPTKSPFSTKKVIVKKSHQQIVVKKVQKKNGKKGVSKTEKGSDDESGGSAADEDAYPAKIYCRPLNLSKLIKGFSDEEKEAIREIGFGGLLDLNLTKFPREIIPLLIQSFCPDSLLFKVNEQVSFVLSKYDVYDCFQLPMGDNPLELVPTGRNRLSQAEDCLALKQQWSQRYGICDAKKGIPLGSVARTLTNHHSMNEFKQAFVLYAMGVFLAPTYTTCIDLHLLKAVDNVDNIANIDWCLYVFKKNVEALERTVDKTTCSVCIPFILIAYLHRFAFRGEEMPSSLPLIKHWTYESMYQRVRLELKTGGLGNAPMSAVKYPISILGIEHKVVKNDWRKISSEILKSQNDSKNDSKRNSDEDKGLDSDTRVEKDVEMQSDLEDSNSKDENDGEMKSNSDSQDDEDVEMLCNLNSPENEDEEVTKSPFSKNGATVQGTPMKNITQSVPSACTSSTTKSHKSDFATAKFEGFDTREPEGDEDLDSNSRDENDGEMQSDLFGQDKEREGMECYSDSQDENGKMQCNLNIQENEDEEVTRTLLSMKGGNDGNGATEQGTSIKNINITPSMPRACTLKRPRSDPLTTKFEGYDVRSVFVPTLEKIWRNHGNITKNSIMRSRDMIARALELLATMVRILEDTSVLSLSGSQADHLSSTMSDLRCMGFSVDWLNPFVEKAIKLHKSKPLLDSWNNLCQSSSQVEKHRAVLLDELAKLDEKKNKLKEEIVMVSKRIPFFGQVKFDNPLGSGLT